ncbi:hypothetical protein L596_003881 [Steinernema carpocapsae]|uniref:MI domain-containing protein n=1 Tax=Steinernema carpocapsae TaxID=34508 RepID=A0A4U8UTU8_STECR|nr:hypothetical protein L596_003881 [Steinernema carpocapsae]
MSCELTKQTDDAAGRRWVPVVLFVLPSTRSAVCFVGLVALCEYYYELSPLTMDAESGSLNAVRSFANKHNKRNKFVRCEDPELAAEIRYAKENGTSVPSVLATSPIETKVVLQTATILQDMKKVAPNQTKMSKKARNRGVSGCSIKKDGGRFELGLEDIYLTEQHVDDDFVENDADEAKESVSRSVSTDEDVSDLDINRMHIKCIVLDYFENGDLDEAIESIQKYATAMNCLVMCTTNIMCAHLEGGSSWGQLASTLLARLMDEDLISRYTLMKATEEVLGNMNELLIDHPHAIDLISRLFARLLSDQLLSDEIFLALRSKFMNNALATKCCLKTMAYASNPVTIAEAPSGDHLPLEVLSNQLKFVLKEYLTSNDVREAAQRTLKLEVPHFSHELVFLAGEMAMEKMHGSVMDQLAELLKFMLEEGEILESCIDKGFQRLYDAIPGMSLDLPAVYSLASMWTKKSLSIGLISQNIAAKCPTNVRGRLLSEGPNGKLICMDDDSVDSGISGSVSES